MLGARIKYDTHVSSQNKIYFQNKWSEYMSQSFNTLLIFRLNQSDFLVNGVPNYNSCCTWADHKWRKHAFVLQPYYYTYGLWHYALKLCCQTNLWFVRIFRHVCATYGTYATMLEKCIYFWVKSSYTLQLQKLLKPSVSSMHKVGKTYKPTLTYILPRSHHKSFNTVEGRCILIQYNLSHWHVHLRRSKSLTRVYCKKNPKF